MRSEKMGGVNHQVLLLKGSISMHEEEKVDLILKTLGFGATLKIGEASTNCVGKSVAGEFTGVDYFEVISELRNKIKEECKRQSVGTFEFLLVNVTGIEMIHGIWHDGFY